MGQKSISTDDMLTCLRLPSILVCDLPEKYEKLKTDFFSTLLSLLACWKAQSTVLFVNRYARGLPPEGCICNFEIVWLCHLFRRSRVYWTQYGPCKYWSRRGFKCQLTWMFATKVNTIVAGQTFVKAPEKEAFEPHLPKDVRILSCHSLHGPTMSPVEQPLVSCTPLCFAQELIDLLRSSFNIEPTKMPSLSWRISCDSFRSRFVYLSFDGRDL